MGGSPGIAIITVLSTAMVIAGLWLVLYGQNIDTPWLWTSMIFGGFVLLVIGIHLLLASLLTYVRMKRKQAQEVTPSI